MKIKTLIQLFVFINGLLISALVYGDDPVKTGVNDSTASGSGESLGWQEQTRRTQVLVTDGIRITAGPSVGSNGLVWSIGFSSNFSIIDCCRPCADRHSWCNFNADEERCDN